MPTLSTVHVLFGSVSMSEDDRDALRAALLDFFRSADWTPTRYVCDEVGSDGVSTSLCLVSSGSGDFALVWHILDRYGFAPCWLAAGCPCFEATTRSLVDMQIWVSEMMRAADAEVEADLGC